MADVILGGNFTVYYTADNNRKQIQWTGSATGTNTVNQLYSALQDLFDELNQMDDGTPMSAQTPTQYTIGAIDASDIVPWFIDDESIQHLTGGALTTRLWTRITGTQPGIIKVTCSANTSIVFSDIGYTITNGTAYGILLYLRGSGASTELYIRPTDSSYSNSTSGAYAAASDWSTSSATITCNTHTATSSVGVPNYYGESLWANIYSLGTIAVDKGNNPLSDLYVYRNGSKVTSLLSGVSAYQWWPSGPFDILMKVKTLGGTIFTANTSSGNTTITALSINSGLLRTGQALFGNGISAGTTVSAINSYNSVTLSSAPTLTNTAVTLYTPTIDGAYVTVLAREDDTTFDYFAVDLNSGGRNPIPLATGGDLNNTYGYRQITASAGAGTFQVGEIAYVGASLATATAKVYVRSVSGAGATSVLTYSLVGNLTDLTGGTQTVTGAVSGATITTATVANNTTGISLLAMTGMTIGSTVAGYSLDLNNGNGAKIYSIRIDPGINKYPLSQMYEWSKYVTRRGSTDITDNNNINGEAYIGPDYRLTYTTLSGGTPASGDVVFQAATGAFGTVITVDTTDKYIVLRNSRGTFSTGAVYDVNTPTIFTDSGTTASTITPIKPNPYGSFAGGKWFGSTGVSFNNTNLAAGDIQAYQLTALDGSTQSPPNIISIGLTGLLSGDGTGIFRATSGVIAKAQYTMSNVASTGGTSITVTSGTRIAIASDEPQAGYIRAVKTISTGITNEHRYRYSSWASTTFTLASVTTGQNAALTATAATASGNMVTVTLGTAIDTAQVQVGDMVYTYATATPGTPLSAGAIRAINSTTQIVVRDESSTPTLANWSGTGNSIAYNLISATYSSLTDTAYVPLIDYHVSSGTSISNSLIYSADIGVLVRVRQYKSIQPFEQSTTVGSTGLTVSAIRTADTIAT